MYNKNKMFIIISILIGIFVISGNNISSIKVEGSDIFVSDSNLIPTLIAKSIEDIDEIKILNPLSSMPALVEKDDLLQVVFQSDNIDNVFAFISSAYEPVVDEIWLELNSLIKNDIYWEANFLIPEETPEELYNLTIIVEKETEFFYCSRPRSVSVYDKFSDDFLIVHVADFHVGDPRGLLVNINETIGFKSIKRCINEINLVHPDLVVISGDMVFGQLYPFEYSIEYRKCYDLIQKFDVPTFLIPGNHDGYYRFREDGFEFWKEYFGPLYYSFDFGNYHFIGVNSFDWQKLHRLSISFIVLNWGGSIQDEQLNWIKQDLKNTDANLTFMFLHHNPIWETKNNSLLRMGYNNRQELLSIIDEYDVDMVLAGHVHFDSVHEKDETIFITTTTPGSGISKEDGYWGYRIIEVKDGDIVSYNYKEPKYSVPTYKIKCEYEDNMIAKVSNDLDLDISVLIKFAVPLGEYEVQNGVISMTRANNFMQEVYVNAIVPSQDQLKVILIPIR